MAEFINPDDYDVSIHREILDSIIRQDEAVLEICEDQAIAQMKSYLGSRYDCEKIFSARGKDRNALILMFAIDIPLPCLQHPQSPEVLFFPQGTVREGRQMAGDGQQDGAQHSRRSESG